MFHDNEMLKLSGPDGYNENEMIESSINSNEKVYCGPFEKGMVAKYKFKSDFICAGYGFRLTDEPGCEHRDPKRWRVKGKVGGQLVDLDK